MKPFVDWAYRLALKIAYWLVIRFYRISGYRPRGVFVLIWHDDRLLVLKNSYRTRYSFPGGLLKRREEPWKGALRETHEEVGIELTREQLVDRGPLVDRLGGQAHLFEVYLPDEPSVTIDQREVVWAQFTPIGEAMDMPLSREIKKFLRDKQTAGV